jgi:hypothetical protein
MGPQAQKINVTALPLLFHTRSKAKLMAETAHLFDLITAAAHILSSYAITFAPHGLSLLSATSPCHSIQ